MPDKLLSNKTVLVCALLGAALVFIMLARILYEAMSYPHVTRSPDEWKTELKPVGFIGFVSDKNDFNVVDRGLFTIELKNVKIKNDDSIPADCVYFTYEKGILKFVAYSETAYNLEDDYSIEKKVNNDTMFVYTPDHQLKYVFELFDGIVYEWTPRQLPHQDK